MKILYLILIIAFSNITCFAAGAKNAKDCALIYSVKIDTLNNKTKIIFTWPKDTSNQGYYIKKKLKTEKDFSFEAYASISPVDTMFVDTTITRGISYEYQFEKWVSSYSAWAYANVGIDLPYKENMGDVIIFIDSTLQIPLSNEINEFVQTLYAEGYNCDVKYVARTEKFNPENVKIIKDYILAKNKISPIRSVILLGRVAVPYAGNNAIDGHNDHQGAWPADIYYTDLTGTWTDNTVTSTKSKYERNYNLPEDGKFDQDGAPGKIEIELGRIDFYNLPSYKETELELLRRYLKKDIAYRKGLSGFTENMIIDDQFNMYSNEAFGSNGWINGSALLDKSKIDTGSMRTKLQTDKYMFTYGCNSGSMNSVMFIGYTFEYAVQNENFIFGNYFGSWFCDYDEEDNFLRASIASQPWGLTAAWNGRPYWFYHHMGLGETVGYSAKITADNYGEYMSEGKYGFHGGHVVLMGDPTLKMRFVAAPDTAYAQILQDEGRVKINWSKIQDPNVLAYFVYKADKSTGEFKKIATVTPEVTSIIDSLPELGSASYKIRALSKLYSKTGSYYEIGRATFVNLGFFPQLDAESVSLFTAPNPIIGKTAIVAALPKAGYCVIDLYDAFGAKALNLFSGELNRGGNIIPWNDAYKYSSGAYYITLTYNGLVKSYPIRIVR